jgi:catechol 2,3-dioxygenase-like lactoylglutathione lyase family enzyme
MLKQSRLVYLVIYVSDLSRARAFYEDILGFRAIEPEAGSVKYDGGHVILLLNRAADYGITLAPGRDNSTDIVFLVEDLARTRAALEARGVAFTPTVKYEIGAITDFYDPDGHWLTLYEPSATAMTWPSGDKIRSVLRARGKPALVSGPAAPPPAVGDAGREVRLDGAELIYVFQFVRDAEQTCTFFHDRLGLTYLEGSPCSQGLTSKEDGVMKYDAGGVMIATHHIEGTVLTDGTRPVAADLSEHSCPPRELDPEHTQGVAAVFHVPDVDRAVKDLSGRGVRFANGVARSPVGAVARFEGPSGHLFYLYEPSAAALDSPSGAKLREILRAPV